jgi:hypothetical protein
MVIKLRWAFLHSQGSLAHCNSSALWWQYSRKGRPSLRILTRTYKENSFVEVVLEKWKA